MDISGDRSNSDKDNGDTIEESSNEHEQDSSVNEQTTDSNELLPTVQQAIHGGQQFNDVQGHTNEQNNELTARPPDHPEAQASQVSSNVWYCRWFILTQLVLHIGLFWQWLVSILADIGIRIFGPLNRNGYVKNNNFQQPNTLIILFMLLTTMIILTHTPLDVENTQPNDLMMFDNTNNTHQNVPMNNDSSDVNKDATLNNNLDHDITNAFADDEPNVQAIAIESIPSEVVDDPTYNINPVDSTEAQDDTDSNHDSDEESDKIRSSGSSYLADDEDETDHDSDNGYSTKSESGSIKDNDENLIPEINFDMNGEHDQIDDNDGMSNISHITDNEDDISVSTDDAYSTKSENSLSSEVNSDANGENSSIDEDDGSLSSDNGYETNGEHSSINNDVDQRSLNFEINCEINNENDQIDDNDRWSIITHITYETSSEDDSIIDNDEIITDQGYYTKSKDDSLISNDEEDIIIELQNNAPLDQKVSTVEQSIPSILSTASTSDQLLTSEENAGDLIYVGRQKIVLSTNPTGMDSINQPDSISLDDESNEGRPSSQVLDNPTCNINPLASTEIQENTNSNHGSGNENERLVGPELILDNGDENDHLVFSNYHQDQMASNIETPLNNIQNNAQLDQISHIAEQSAAQMLPSDIDSSSDQPSPIEQQAVDQTEDDRQEIVPSSRPTNMHFQKQPSPIVNCNEGPFKQNTE